MCYESIVRQCQGLSRTHRGKTVCIIADEKHEAINCGIEGLYRDKNTGQIVLFSAESVALNGANETGLTGGFLYIARTNEKGDFEQNFETHHARELAGLGVKQVCLVSENPVFLSIEDFLERES